MIDAILKMQPILRKFTKINQTILIQRVDMMKMKIKTIQTNLVHHERCVSLEKVDVVLQNATLIKIYIKKKLLYGFIIKNKK